jgi:hypothetical protein
MTGSCGTHVVQQVCGVTQEAAVTSSWSPGDPGAPSTRCARFTRPLVLLGKKVGGPKVLRELLQSAPLQLQVHDRRARPEPAEFPVPDNVDAILVGPKSNPSSLPVQHDQILVTLEET